MDDILTSHAGAQEDGQQLGCGQRTRPIVIESFARSLALGDVADHGLICHVLLDRLIHHVSSLLVHDKFGQKVITLGFHYNMT